MEKETERGHSIDLGLPSLIFMGTPDFAIPSLKKLSDLGASIPLVVTQPDRPKGRGKKLAAPPVKVLAEELGLQVFQPRRLRDRGAVEVILSFAAECAVVVAYGQLLPEEILRAHPLGAINVHASLLPRYRGAAPIQRSILCGDSVTGISVMLLDAGMDTGPVLAQREMRIREDDTFLTLHDKMAEMGADLLCETLRLWRAGRIQPGAQGEAGVSHAPPIRKEELRISWHFPARQIVNMIRAFDPWPGAFSLYQGKRVKCFKASLLKWKADGAPGEVVGQVDGGLVVLAGDLQALSIGELQLEGQRRLGAADFLRGHAIPPGSCLE